MFPGHISAGIIVQELLAQLTRYYKSKPIGVSEYQITGNILPAGNKQLKP
jgi:hypothetical protein